MLASLIQSVQATLNTETQSLSVLFYKMNDVKRCSMGVSFSDPVRLHLRCTH